MLRTYVFIDAGHIRHGLDALGVAWEEVNLAEVATVSLKWAGAQWRADSFHRDRVFVYDAVPEEEQSVETKVSKWLARNDELADVHVRYGRLAGEPQSGKLRQKGVDIQLAVDALGLIANGVFEVAVLIAGDGDLAPLVEAIRDRGPLVAVCAFPTKLSDELKRQADRVGFLPDDPNAWAGWKLPSHSAG